MIGVPEENRNLNIWDLKNVGKPCASDCVVLLVMVLVLVMVMVVVVLVGVEVRCLWGWGRCHDSGEVGATAHAAAARGPMGPACCLRPLSAGH